MSESANFDALSPLHPHVDAGSSSARFLAHATIVERAGAPGYRTSEFWVVIVAILAPTALAFFDTGARALNGVALGSGIAAGGYAIGRSYLKAKLAHWQRERR